MPETVTQEQRDRQLVKSFGTEAANSKKYLIAHLKLQIGVLEQQIADERAIAYGVVVFVAIACTILGRLL